MLSLGRDHILFVVPTAPPDRTTAFTAPRPKRSSCCSASSSAPSRARFRPRRAACSPASFRPQEAGRYFGLLALSGKVTSFLAPLAVAVATRMFQTQAAGPAVLILFFCVGGWLLERRQARLSAAHSSVTAVPLTVTIIMPSFLPMAP